MTRKLAFIHTVTSLVTLFNDLSREILPPDVEVFHIADEMLLKVVLAQGGLSPFIFRRVADHVRAAEAAGADAVQVTCSSIGPCVEPARTMVGVPVLKVDEPMVRQAIALGRRIGVAATAPTTLQPTADLVHSLAREAGQDVQVEAVLCEGAYAALFGGRPADHDRIVRDYLQTLMTRVDVILLAQASMARVADTFPPEARRVPILASPRLAVERARDVLAQVKP
jgi:Asp/Glu/hydantoin racemase